MLVWQGWRPSDDGGSHTDHPKDRDVSVADVGGVRETPPTSLRQSTTSVLAYSTPPAATGAGSRCRAPLGCSDGAVTVQ